MKTLVNRMLLTSCLIGLSSFGGHKDEYAHLKKSITDQINSFETKADSISFIDIHSVSMQELIIASTGRFDFNIKEDSLSLDTYNMLLKSVQYDIQHGDKYTKAYEKAQSRSKEFTQKINDRVADIAQNIARKDSTLNAARYADTVKGAGFSCLVFIRYQPVNNYMDTMTVKYIFLKDSLYNLWPMYEEL